MYRPGRSGGSQSPAVHVSRSSGSALLLIRRWGTVGRTLPSPQADLATVFNLQASAPLSNSGHDPHSSLWLASTLCLPLPGTWVLQVLSLFQSMVLTQKMRRTWMQGCVVLVVLRSAPAHSQHISKALNIIANTSFPLAKADSSSVARKNRFL